MGCLVLANVLSDLLLNMNDQEAKFRGFVGLGTLLSSGSPQIKEKVTENEKFVENLHHTSLDHDNETESKTSNCAKQVRALLFSK